MPEVRPASWIPPASTHTAHRCWRSGLHPTLNQRSGLPPFSPISCCSPLQPHESSTVLRHTKLHALRTSDSDSPSALNSSLPNVSTADFLCSQSPSSNATSSGQTFQTAPSMMSPPRSSHILPFLPVLFATELFTDYLGFLFVYFQPNLP